MRIVVSRLYNKRYMPLLYILWDGRPILMISGSNEQLQQQLEYTLLKPDCYCWWISKLQSGTLEERYAIKFRFKLGKNATETYGMRQTAFGASCMNPASVFELHNRFKEDMVSVSDDERSGSSKEVNTPELIGQRFRLELGLLCWYFKGVQKEIPREEASTPQTFPQPPYFQTLIPVTFGFSLSSEAVVMRQFRRWKRLLGRSLTRSHERTSMGPSRSCWNFELVSIALFKSSTKNLISVSMQFCDIWHHTFLYKLNITRLSLIFEKQTWTACLHTCMMWPTWKWPKCLTL